MFNMGRVWIVVEFGVCLWEIFLDFIVRIEVSVGWNFKEYRCVRWNLGWVFIGGFGFV